MNGAEEITVSLLEAADNFDSGDIWKKMRITIPKHALFNEINDLLFGAESKLMDFAVDSFLFVQPRAQNSSVKTNSYNLRTPTDSELDLKKSLESQFNLLRVCDPIRFPAYFTIFDHRYKITIEKIDDE